MVVHELAVGIFDAAPELGLARWWRSSYGGRAHCVLHLSDSTPTGVFAIGPHWQSMLVPVQNRDLDSINSKESIESTEGGKRPKSCLSGGKHAVFMYFLSTAVRTNCPFGVVAVNRPTLSDLCKAEMENGRSWNANHARTALVTRKLKLLLPSDVN